MVNTIFSQSQYKVKIIRSDFHSIIDNKEYLDTIYGTIIIPRKSNSSNVDLVLDGETISIPERIWIGNNDKTNKTKLTSKLKPEIKFHVLDNALITENLFYNTQKLTSPRNFKNVIALKSLKKTVVFGYQENMDLKSSCYSLEINKELSKIIRINIDFNQVVNTSAFERRIEEIWELTRIE